MGETAKPYTEDALVVAAPGDEHSGLATATTVPNVPLSSVEAAAQSAVIGKTEDAGSIPAGGQQEPSHLDLDVLGNYPKIFGNSQSSLVEAASARVSAQGGQLTEAEAISVLEAAGWPTELIPQALAVAWCESKWSPYARGDSGRSVGLFQLNLQTWFTYAGEDPTEWADPLVNARTALTTYRYDIARGYPPWKQWSCKP